MSCLAIVWVSLMSVADTALYPRQDRRHSFRHRSCPDAPGQAVNRRRPGHGNPAQALRARLHVGKDSDFSDLATRAGRKRPSWTWVASYQAATRFRMRIRWLVPALRLPGQVVGDMVIVYAALWRRLARGEQPNSAFVTEPVRFGDDRPAGLSRPGQLIVGRSGAPQAFP